MQRSERLGPRPYLGPFSSAPSRQEGPLGAHKREQGTGQEFQVVFKAVLWDQDPVSSHQAPSRPSLGLSGFLKLFFLTAMSLHLLGTLTPEASSVTFTCLWTGSASVHASIIRFPGFQPLLVPVTVIPVLLDAPLRDNQHPRAFAAYIGRLTHQLICSLQQGRCYRSILPMGKLRLERERPCTGLTAGERWTWDLSRVCLAGSHV